VFADQVKALLGRAIFPKMSFRWYCVILLKNMLSLAPEFRENGTSFCATWLSARGEVDISIDKAAFGEATLELIATLKQELDDWLRKSLLYFKTEKNRYGCDYIDDLSDPHIIIDTEGFAIYWSSAAGETRGDVDVGVDFDYATLTPRQLTIGD
jgi:hypothetical protein